MNKLAGKTAIITGASKGIGEATARLMAEHGANVVLAARSEGVVKKISREIKTTGGRAIGAACDVSDYTQAKATIDLAVETFGSIDIIVNNAGLIDPIARIKNSDPDDWGKVFDVNVKGVYHMIQAALPFMEDQQSGVIINISSGAATSALEGWNHYCASKAAALSLTRCTHTEAANNGIRVIGLSPGTVATDMQVAIKASGINPVSQLDPSVHIPPQWVAQTICWMATDDAKEFDGGDVSLRDEEIRQRVGLG